MISIYKIKLQLFFFAIWLLFNLEYSKAVPADSTLSDSVVHIDDVVVKASRFQAKLKDIPGSVQFISGNDINRNVQISLPEALNNLPGIYMQTGNEQTSRLTIRGVGSRNPYGSARIKAYYNEIPLSMADGTTVMGDIEPFFISRADIVKGPNSAWYGSGLGGAIYFTGPTNVRNLHSQVQLSTGSFETYKTLALVQVPFSNAGLNIGFSFLSGDGYRQNSSFYRRTMLLSGSIGSTHKLYYLVNASDVRSHIPSSLDYTNYNQNPQLAAANWLNVKGYKHYKRLLGGLRLESKPNHFFTNSLSVSGNLIDPYELRPFNILDDRGGGYSVNGNFKAEFNWFTMIAGAEFTSEDYHWKILQNNTLREQQNTGETREQLNIYWAFQTRITKKLLFSINVNANKTNYQVSDLLSDSINYSRNAHKDFILSPRTGFIYDVSANTSAFISFGHGFSNPTIEESLDSKGFLNENLKPEQGWSFDVGIRTNIFNKSLWLEATYYNIQLDNLLVTKRISEELFMGENAGSASLQGIELMLKYQYNNRLFVQSSFQYSLNRFKSFEGTTDYSGNRLPGIPLYLANFDLTYHFKSNYDIRLNSYFSGKQYLTDDNSITEKSWWTMNIQIDRKFTVFSKELVFEAGLKNIFNRHYASMILVNAPSFGSNLPRYYYPGMPRNYYFGIKLYL